MFSDGLGELFSNEFRTGLTPVGGLPTNHQAFEGAGPITAGLALEALLQVWKGYPATQDFWSQRKAERIRKDIATPGAPEPVLNPVIHVEQDKPVGQTRVLKRMLGGAPLPEKDPVAAELIHKGNPMLRQPSCETRELAREGGQHVLPPILGKDLPVRIY